VKEIVMKSLSREAGFAVLAWLIPLAMSVCIFPLKRSHPPLFESLMGLTLVGSTVVRSLLYLRRHSARFLWTGIRIGITWMVANWLLDGLMFSGGPMKMSVRQYLNEIAAAYLMIPVITVGLAAAAAQATRMRRSS
jgi:hypothetical protein